MMLFKIIVIQNFYINCGFVRIGRFNILCISCQQVSIVGVNMNQIEDQNLQQLVKYYSLSKSFYKRATYKPLKNESRKNQGKQTCITYALLGQNEDSMSQVKNISKLYWQRLPILFLLHLKMLQNNYLLLTYLSRIGFGLRVFVGFFSRNIMLCIYSILKIYIVVFLP